MKVFKAIPQELPQTPLLEKIQSPNDLNELSSDQLKRLADELREFLLFQVGQTGGHLAGGLGVIELTVVLHHLFDAPTDKIIWDVGHQAYPHKVLTGRKDQLKTIRKKGGLAPFPSKNESEYDVFGVGHSSTSISAALGMSEALKEQSSKIVCVIGDGAMTAGMAFEALSHAGHLRPNMLIILNDNDMSISENVGGLSNYFSRIWASKLYKGIRKGGKSFLENLPQAHHIARKVETQMKSMVAPGTIFEELGLNYIGPVDGHNIDELLQVVGNLKDFDGPQFLHIITKKGAGLDDAEADRIGFHAIGKIKPVTKKSKKTSSPKYQDIFSDWIVDMAERDSDLVAITPAMREGSGLVEFSKKYPDRYFDVAIAEQHAITFAAGLACESKKPVVAIYSTFLQRAYDQLIHDVALQNLNVTFAIDRAGLVGEDGPTHSGNFDIAYLQCIPNMVIASPSNENEARKLLSSVYEYDGPAAVRYPRGQGPGEEIDRDLETVKIGKANLLKKGSSKLIMLNFGSLLNHAKEIAKKYDMTLIDMRFIKPFDEGILKKYSSAKWFITIEDGSLIGGIGSTIANWVTKQNFKIQVKCFGIPDKFIEHMSREEMIKEAKLDYESITKELDKIF